MGNPFTSAINAAAFIAENTLRIDPWYQALYVYDGRIGEESYKYVSSTVPGWEEPYYKESGSAGDKVQVGQGFFVLALHDKINFMFTPGMQVHSNNVLLKSTSTDDPWPGIRLNVRSGDENRHTTLVFDAAMSTGKIRLRCRDAGRRKGTEHLYSPSG